MINITLDCAWGLGKWKSTKGLYMKIYVFSKKTTKIKVKKDEYILKHKENFRSGYFTGSEICLD